MPISPKRTVRRCAAVILPLAVAACDAPQTHKAQPSAAPVPTASGPELVPSPPGLDNLQAYVAREFARSQKEQRPLLVYVGAAWCEPCRHFHEAVQSGALKAVLPPVRLLEFDHDTQHEALAAAGYAPKLLPLFSIPNADGTASARKIEGSIKGETAVKVNLIPRLQALLAPAAP